MTRLFFAVLLALLVAAAPALAHSEEPKSHGPDTKALDKRGRTPAAPPYAVDAHAAWSASQWDGQKFTTDQPDLAPGEPTVHAIYLYPSNKPSRYLQFAAMFQADARQANSLLASLYGRGVRFDNRAGGYLDITEVKSKSTDKKLSGGQQFNLVHNELIAKGFNNPNKKYAVWLDSGSRYCGQGQLYQDTRRTSANNNNLRTTAIVYRPYANDASTGGFCRGRTLLHEVGHNLGALQGVAPNAFDGAHCDDSAEDVMCYTSATSNDTGPAAFDYGNDDYWGVLPWWTVDLNRFVCAGPC